MAQTLNSKVILELFHIFTAKDVLVMLNAEGFECPSIHIKTLVSSFRDSSTLANI